MPSLKDLRVRIKSIKSTQKITSAMKMVAGAKLRKAHERVEQARPYTHHLQQIVENCLHDDALPDQEKPLLLKGDPNNPCHLLVLFTSDRGLCGGFNSSLVRQTKILIERLKSQGKHPKVFCIGRKGRDILKRDYNDLILDCMTDIGKTGPRFDEAEAISDKLLNLLTSGQVGTITCIYTIFKSALVQKLDQKTITPLEVKAQEKGSTSLYEYEPSQKLLLDQLLPYNFATQIFQILLETHASEHGARMTAMDNATRNAQDVIRRLELNYNRTRQAYITKELIEIISGAEAI
jgi:F-type H+-transporting ATPase subunit gamma